MKKEFDIEVKWRAFPLHPNTPDEGLTLEELFAGTTVNVEQMLIHLAETAAQLELPFGERKKTFNSRRAQELGLWAEESGRGDAFHRAAFRAYFADGKNLAHKKVLLDIAASAGLPVKQAELAIEQRACRELVDKDWQLSRRKGVTAVPTFIMADNRLIGAQAYEDLVRLVRVHGADRR